MAKLLCDKLRKPPKMNIRNGSKRTEYVCLKLEDLEVRNCVASRKHTLDDLCLEGRLNFQNCSLESANGELLTTFSMIPF